MCIPNISDFIVVFTTVHITFLRLCDLDIFRGRDRPIIDMCYFTRGLGKQRRNDWRSSVSRESYGFFYQNFRSGLKREL